MTTSKSQTRRGKGKRPDRFVVGYNLPGNCVYGLEHFYFHCSKGIASPMKYREALRESKKLISPRYSGILYELVPLQPKPKKRGAK